MYADDTTLLVNEYHLPSLIRKIESELKNINKWVLSNRLILNISKTKFMVFTNKHNSSIMQLRFNDMTIDRVDQHNFLGVLIDSKLNFKYHIQYICSKVYKAVEVLFKLSSYMPSEI